MSFESTTEIYHTQRPDIWLRAIGYISKKLRTHVTRGPDNLSLKERTQLLINWEYRINEINIRAISLTEDARSSDVNNLARPKSPASDMHNIRTGNQKTWKNFVKSMSSMTVWQRINAGHYLGVCLDLLSRIYLNTENGENRQNKAGPQSSHMS